MPINQWVWNKKEHVLELQIAAVAVILLKLFRRYHKIIKQLNYTVRRGKKLATM